LEVSSFLHRPSTIFVDEFQHVGDGGFEGDAALSGGGQKRAGVGEEDADHSVK
jgi:hypothetical protein